MTPTPEINPAQAQNKEPFFMEIDGERFYTEFLTKDDLISMINMKLGLNKKMKAEVTDQLRRLMAKLDDLTKSSMDLRENLKSIRENKIPMKQEVKPIGINLSGTEDSNHDDVANSGKSESPSQNLVEATMPEPLQLLLEVASCQNQQREEVEENENDRIENGLQSVTPLGGHVLETNCENNNVMETGDDETERNVVKNDSLVLKTDRQSEEQVPKLDAEHETEPDTQVSLVVSVEKEVDNKESDTHQVNVSEVFPVPMSTPITFSAVDTRRIQVTKTQVKESETDLKRRSFGNLESQQLRTRRHSWSDERFISVAQGLARRDTTLGLVHTGCLNPVTISHSDCQEQHGKEGPESSKPPKAKKKPWRSGKKPKSKKNKGNYDFEVPEYEKEMRITKNKFKLRYQFYLKHQDEIRGDGRVIHNNIAKSIQDMISWCEENRCGVSEAGIKHYLQKEGQKTESVENFNPKKVVHTKPLFYTLVSELRADKNYQKWIDEDITYLAVKYEDKTVLTAGEYFTEVITYMRDVYWIAIKTYMDWHTRYRDSVFATEGITDLEREMIAAAKLNTAERFPYENSDFFKSRLAYHENLVKEHPNDVTFVVHYEILGNLPRTRDDFNIKVLDFDFYWLSQLSLEEIDEKEQEYFDLLFRKIPE